MLGDEKQGIVCTSGSREGAEREQQRALTTGATHVQIAALYYKEGKYGPAASVVIRGLDSRCLALPLSRLHSCLALRLSFSVGISRPLAAVALWPSASWSPASYSTCA